MLGCISTDIEFALDSSLCERSCIVYERLYVLNSIVVRVCKLSELVIPCLCCPLRQVPSSQTFHERHKVSDLSLQILVFRG